jgi:NAD(P)-dependent dehydrogenase (short-subunit alcohol dehydrogenase family)
LGKELVKLVYQRNAKVYIAARSETKARAAIKEIQDAFPASKGQLEYLYLDLSDLSTIKRSAQDFLGREHRLDILWNNAGVMIPPQGSKTAQGWELQLGVNSIGTFLFTEQLHGILATTAQTAPKNSVRVVWVSSGSAPTAPKPAIDFDNMDYKRDESPYTKYSRSKAGNVIHAAEFARRAAGEGILTIVRPISEPQNFPCTAN